LKWLPKQNKEEDIYTRYKEKYNRVWKRKQEEPKMDLYAHGMGLNC